MSFYSLFRQMNITDQIQKVNNINLYKNPVCTESKNLPYRPEICKARLLPGSDTSYPLSVILIKYPYLHLYRLGNPCKDFLVNLSDIFNDSVIVKCCYLLAKSDAVLLQAIAPVC